MHACVNSIIISQLISQFFDYNRLQDEFAPQTSFYYKQIAVYSWFAFLMSGVFSMLWVMQNEYILKLTLIIWFIGNVVVDATRTTDVFVGITISMTSFFGGLFYWQTKFQLDKVTTMIERNGILLIPIIFILWFQLFNEYANNYFDLYTSLWLLSLIPTFIIVINPSLLNNKKDYHMVDEKVVDIMKESDLVIVALFNCLLYVPLMYTDIHSQLPFLYVVCYLIAVFMYWGGPNVVLYYVDIGVFALSIVLIATLNLQSIYVQYVVSLFYFTSLLYSQLCFHGELKERTLFSVLYFTTSPLLLLSFVLNPVLTAPLVIVCLLCAAIVIYSGVSIVLNSYNW